MQRPEAVDPCCRFCMHCRAVDAQEAVCKKRGVVALDFTCRRFRYDPLKRTPPIPGYLKQDTFSAEDFSIE